MKILRIKGRNINSLKGDYCIDFTNEMFVDSGIFAITGPTGSGKTTLLDTMCLALYNEVPRKMSPKDDVMTKHCVSAIAEVEFSVKELTYRSSWSQRRARSKPDGNLQSAKMDLSLKNEEHFDIIASGLSKVPKEIAEITGLDFSRFCQSVMLAQGQFMAFLEAGENERAHLLEKMTGADIYASLSKMAYKKGNVEQKKLEQLNQDLDQIELLTDEEIKTLTESLKKEKNNISCLKKEQETKLAIQSYLKDFQTVRKRLEQLSEEKQSLEHEKEQKAVFIDKLEHFNKTQEVYEAIRQKSIIVEQFNEQKTKEDEHLAQIKLLEDKIKTEQMKLEKISLQAADYDKSSAVELRNAEAAKEIDIKIDNLQDSLQKINNQTDSNLKKTKVAQKEKKSAVTELQKSEKKYQTICDWLENNSCLQMLPVEISGIKRSVEHFCSNLSKIDELKENKQKLDHKLIEADEATETNKKAYQACKHNLKGLNDKLNTIQNELDILLENKSHKEQQDSIEKLRNSRAMFENAHELLLDKKSINNKMQNTLSESETAKKTILKVQDQLENVLNKVAMQNEQLQKTEQLFSLQKKVIDLEQERNQLIEGQPCALCGSTTHPYAQGVDFELSKSESEIDRLKKKIKQLEEEKIKLNSSLSETRGKLEILQKQADDYKANEQTVSTRLCSIFKELNLPEDTLIDQVIDKLDKTQKQLETAMQAFESVNRNQHLLLQETKNRDKVQNELLEKNIEAEKLNGQRSNLISKLESCNNEIQQLKSKTDQDYQKLKKTFNSYKIEIGSDDIQKTLLELEKHSEEYQKTCSEEIKLKENIKELSYLKQSIEQRISILDDEHKNLINEKNTLEAQLKIKNDERYKVFGDNDVSETIQNIRLTQDSLQIQLKKANKEFGELELNHARVSQTVTCIQESLTKFANSLHQANENVAKLLAKHSIDNESDYITSLPTDKEKEIAKNFLDTYKARLDELKGKTDESQKIFINLQSKIPQETTIDLITEEIANIINSLEISYSNKSSYEQQLDLNAKSREKHVQKVALINEQKHETNKWLALKQLIGSAEGDVFRKFAQGLTLEVLVKLANMQLNNFTKRYMLCRKNKNSMQFEIIDKFQADVKRPVGSLSGGESFLVSLAFALALSELASQSIKIESLFLDEGFGTLDVDTLDIALSSLSALQAQGRIIGIISHVESLKERVPAQIKVVPTNSGYSTVQIATN